MTARGTATRARLIAATTEVVGRVGYARATTRAIAEAAGVAEGTIYRHFPDKQQLFLAAVLDRNAAVVEWVADLPDLAGRGTVRENLAEALRRLGRLRADLLPLEIALRADPELARGYGAVPVPDGPPRLLAEYLAAEQRLGRVRAGVDPGAASLVLLATLFGLAMAPLGSTEEIPAAAVDAAVDLLVEGLRPS